TSPGSYPPIEMLIRDSRDEYHYFDVRARTLQRGSEPLIVFVARPTHERDALQRRHRLYFEEAPAALGSIVPGERGVDANGPMAELFGRTREAMLSIDGTQLLHPDDRAASRRVLTALETNGLPRVEVVRRFVKADGSTFYGRVLITTIRTPAGAIERLLFTIADVTSEREARELLARSEARFRALVEHSPDIVAIIRADGDWEASQQGTRLLGYPKGFDPPGGALSLVHPDDAERAGEALVAIFDGRRAPGQPLELRLRAADGTYREFECIGQNLDGEPSVSGVVITARDITQRRAAERALGQAESRFRATFERAPMIISMVDASGCIIDINPTGCRLLGRSRDELIGTPAEETVHPDDRALAIDATLRQLGGEQLRAEFRIVRADGTEWWALSSAVQVDSDDPYFLTLQVDITAQKRLEEELRVRATHDPLTGVRNRAAVVDHLELLLARRVAEPVTVMFVDLDGFKAVNDALGHSAGDAVLTGVAQRIENCLRPEDVVARIGGDEFVVVCATLDSAATAQRLGARVREAIAAPVTFGSTSVHVDASIGIARSTADDDTAGLLMRADAAAYRAKSNGRGRVELADSPAV
ncbi:MAG TPA: PAS domain S-box protein, partial [Acidimicrobiia bacterium]